ncbi:LysM peptidoglycan-binding domain-containing protein [Fictibacillus sp. b24]|uniref:LysM peptidoglycan-binding domain-containing protein n=1 Tax=Fictibacillus sp. b24 TaxID=3055863 RepID=UPI0025A10E3A|nr:LysM peptidoglycan-binding domain-containing protein [Fictibacillus sp. b24]MDM5316963.1 LysM peptidoglycan-binding domain-containing protein [Fictibacillus sp. b24]
MDIHVVQRGDSLWKISQRYGVSITSIVRTNAIENQNVLVIGQALVIPNEFPTYRIQSGDTLFDIASRYGTSVESLIGWNNIPLASVIYVGQLIDIPIHVVKQGESLYMIANRYGTSVADLQKENRIANPNLVYVGTRLSIPYIRPVKEVNSYVTNMGEANQTEVRNVGSYLTYITPFSYSVTRTGGLTALQDEGIISAARVNRVAPLMGVSNIEGDMFNSDLIKTILDSDSLQETVLNNILNTMRAKGYRGVNFDFEYVYPENKEDYNNFLRRAVAKYKPLGYSVSSALAPKYKEDQPGLLYEAHDYKAHGEIVDFVVVMTYEWGWSGGRAMAIAPLDEVKKVLDYTVTVIPREKIMMGVPTYGRDWTLPFVQGTQAKTLSPVAAVNLAAKMNASIEFDEGDASPWFKYRDDQGKEHEVWFEDARSMQAKYQTAIDYNLRGVSFWVLGIPFPQNWPVIRDSMRVRKI